MGALLMLLILVTRAYSYLICPGTGLRSRTSNEEIIIFEHTEMGTGGLVLNCPTPLKIGNLPIPRFQSFKELPLMLGCGMAAGENDDSSTIPLGEVSPWFWLHDLDDIPGSYEFQGAAGPLYMGGNIEEATKRLQEDGIAPIGHFKFFRKYRSWQAGELEAELKNGEWEVTAQDPAKALKPVWPSIRLS